MQSAPAPRPHTRSRTRVPYGSSSVAAAARESTEPEIAVPGPRPLWVECNFHRSFGIWKSAAPLRSFTGFNSRIGMITIMVILCDGMGRSGSTWSFNVAVQLLRSYDSNRKTFGFYNEKPAVLAAAVRPRSSNLVVKSHALDPISYELCCTGRIKAIYTWRNPYDVVVSCTRMFGSTVEHWVATLQRWLQLWSFHLRTGSACIVPYESIVKEPWAAIGRIAAYLGLSLEPDCLEKIGQEVSFEAVKRFSQHVNELKPPRLIQSGEYVFDRETLLHKDHIRDGRIGYG